MHKTKKNPLWKYIPQKHEITPKLSNFLYTRTDAHTYMVVSPGLLCIINNQQHIM